jgi:hypothetical protein
LTEVAITDPSAKGIITRRLSTSHGARCSKLHGMRPDGYLESIRRAFGFRVASSRFIHPRLRAQRWRGKSLRQKPRRTTESVRKAFPSPSFLKATNCADLDAAPLPDRVMPKQSFAASLLSTRSARSNRLKTTFRMRATYYSKDHCFKQSSLK